MRQGKTSLDPSPLWYDYATTRTKDLALTRRKATLPDPTYFHSVAQAARALGAESFYERLLDLLGHAIVHDYAWIVRYSRNAPPDIILAKGYATGVAKHLTDYYLKHASYDNDPFFCAWRSTERSGVILLEDACRALQDDSLYRLFAQQKARISDEMAVCLPSLGQSCIAMFIEKKRGRFTDRDMSAARAMFPALEGLHKAHLANLFSGLRSAGTSEARKILGLPTLIVDRAGARVHANADWRKLERAEPRLNALRLELDTSKAESLPMSETRMIRVERFERDFQLAPGGAMFVIADKPSDDTAEVSKSRARADFERLSVRQQEIVALLVLGHTIGEIAQRLEIGKGTIKNYRVSLYRKLSISSERTLISRFWPLVDEFRRNPPRCGKSAD